MKDLSIERAIESVKYVARCASVDADKLGLQNVSIELAGACDAADRAAKKLSDARVQARIERHLALREGAVKA